MAKASCLFDGVANLLVFLGGVKKEDPDRLGEIPNLSFYHEILFLDEGIKVWKQSGIGSGYFIKLTAMKKTPRFDGNIFNSSQLNEDFMTKKKHMIDYQKPENRRVTLESDISQSFEDSEQKQASDECAIWFCDNKLCDKKFLTLWGHENHKNQRSKCSIRKRNKTIRNVVTEKVISKFGMSPECQAEDFKSRRQIKTYLEHLPKIHKQLRKKSRVTEGSALRQKKIHKRLIAIQKDYLLERFMEGVRGGKNATGVEVEKQMRRAIDPKDKKKLRFSRAHWLKAGQITSQFGTLSRKQKLFKRKSPKEQSPGLLDCVLSPNKRRRVKHGDSDEDEDSDAPLDDEEKIQEVEEEIAQRNAIIDLEYQRDIIEALENTEDKLDSCPILVRI